MEAVLEGCFEDAEPPGSPLPAKLRSSFSWSQMPPDPAVVRWPSVPPPPSPPEARQFPPKSASSSVRVFHSRVPSSSAPSLRERSRSTRRRMSRSPLRRRYRLPPLPKGREVGQLINRHTTLVPAAASYPATCLQSPPRKIRQLSEIPHGGNLPAASSQPWLGCFIGASCSC